MAQRKARRTIDDGIREWFAEHPGMVACAADLVSAGVWLSEASVRTRLNAMASSGVLRRVRRRSGPVVFALAPPVVPCMQVKIDVKRQRVIELDARGWPQKRIANDVGVSQSRVSQILCKAGRPRGRGRHRAQRISARQQLLETVLLLHDHGMPPDVIAAQTGCDKAVVCDILIANARIPATPRRDKLLAEVRAYTQLRGAVTPLLVWRRLCRDGVYDLTKPAHDTPAPKADPLLTRLHLHEVWREAMVVPAHAVGYSVELQRSLRGESEHVGQ